MRPFLLSEALKLDREKGWRSGRPFLRLIARTRNEVAFALGADFF